MTIKRGYVSVRPTSRLWTTIGENGVTNVSALADIIDNSIDAGASRIEVVVDARDGATNEHTKIFVIDDGDGFDHDINDFIRALRLCDSMKIEKHLGKFGIGLKASTMAVCYKVTVITKHANGASVRMAMFGPDCVSDKNDMEVYLNEFSPDGRHVAGDDAPVAAAKAAYRKYFPDGGHGTVIMMENCQRIHRTSLNEYEKSLREHLGETFRYYIKDRSTVVDGNVDFYIKVNGKPVYAIDPMFRPEFKMFSDPEIVKAYPKAFAPAQEPTMILYKQHRGRDLMLKVSLVRIGEDRIPDRQTTSSTLNMSNQGFYTVRNGRQIRGRSMFNIKHHPEFNRFRGEIEFTPELDDFLRLTNAKNNVTVDPAVRERLSNLYKGLRQECNRIQQTKTKKANLDHVPANERVRLCETKLSCAGALVPDADGEVQTTGGARAAKGKGKKRDKRGGTTRATRSDLGGTHRPPRPAREILKRFSAQRRRRISFKSVPSADRVDFARIDNVENKGIVERSVITFHQGHALSRFCAATNVAAERRKGRQDVLHAMALGTFLSLEKNFGDREFLKRFDHLDENVREQLLEWLREAREGFVTTKSTDIEAYLS